MEIYFMQQRQDSNPQMVAAMPEMTAPEPDKILYDEKESLIKKLDSLIKKLDLKIIKGQMLLIEKEQKIKNIEIIDVNMGQLNQELKTIKKNIFFLEETIINRQKWRSFASSYESKRPKVTFLAINKDQSLIDNKTTINVKKKSAAVPDNQIKIKLENQYAEANKKLKALCNARLLNVEEFNKISIEHKKVLDNAALTQELIDKNVEALNLINQKLSLLKPNDELSVLPSAEPTILIPNSPSLEPLEIFNPEESKNPSAFTSKDIIKEIASKKRKSHEDTTSSSNDLPTLTTASELNIFTPPKASLSASPDETPTPANHGKKHRTDPSLSSSLSDYNFSDIGFGLFNSSSNPSDKIPHAELQLPPLSDKLDPETFKDDAISQSFLCLNAL